MFELLKNLFQLLTASQRKRFYILQLLVAIMSLAEIISVVSIAPFMSLVGDMSLLQQETLLAEAFHFSGIATESQFVFLLGIWVLFMLLVSAIVSMFTTWQLSMFATNVGAEIADLLYSHYLQQGWLFHASSSSAQLTKKIANETTRVTGQVLLPLMQMNARISLALFMSVAIFFYDAQIAIVALAIFVVAYFILYKLVRKQLQLNGKHISKVYEQRFRLMNEGFGGIKDVLLLGRANDFIERFKRTGNSLAYSQGTNTALAQVPRYFMELIAFGSMIMLVLYLITSHDGDLGVILPVLSVYALAGFKLLPAFQQIYRSVAQIKGNISAFESIQKDLVEINTQKTKEALSTEVSHARLNLEKEITLDRVTFSYLGKKHSAINQLTMNIKANNIIGIVGASGSGKSTLIDILLGLIKPLEGCLKVDGEIITQKNLRAWQNIIGFVPQHIFLSEGTIAENVAFGVARKEINYDRVEKALGLSQLNTLVKTLEKGVHTKVGERGVQLSGGQRQRIGIARALYDNADVLVFDEATSALDGITEASIMEAIHSLRDKKTIIMIAHRLKTIKKSDQIFFIDDGKVIDQGTYQELIEKNKRFKEMADHA